MERSRRAPLSQHFLWNRRLVDQLVRASSLTQHDTILEIGPGRGMLTQALLRAARRVIAVEIDPKLCSRLRRRFEGDPRFCLVEGDFLSQPLPSVPYKVFANLPYRRTGDMLRKLLTAEHPPLEAHLVVQQEAAEKWRIHERGNCLAALLHYPWWESNITYRFQRSDFSPPPSVDSVLLRLTRRAAPLLEPRWQGLYQDYVAQRFERDRRAPDPSPEQWLRVFRSQVQHAHPAQYRGMRGAYRRLQRQQQRLEKIHRTRTDPGWKRFRHK